MKLALINALKVISGVLVAIICLEIGLRLVDFDSLGVWSAHTQLGRRLYTVNPEIGWRLKPHLQESWVTRDRLEIPIETNSHGLRDKEHTYEKSPDVYRILLLGDSFAEALQIPLVDAFPTTLESCLSERLGQPVEVINAGTTAYSIGDMYLYYQNEGKQYDPDLVLVSIFPEYAFLDLDRHASERMVRITGAYRFDLEGKQLKKTWLSWSTPEEPISRLDMEMRRYSRVYQILWHPDAKFRSSVEGLAERIIEKFGLTSTEGDQSKKLPPWRYFIFSADFANNSQSPDLLLDRWRVFQRIFEDFQSQVKTDNRNFAVFIIPNKYQAHHQFREDRIIDLAQNYSDLATVDWDLEHEPNKTLMQYFQQNDVLALDLLPYFQAHDADGGYSLYYNEDLHLNREGHYMTRDLLCEWLVETHSISQ